MKILFWFRHDLRLSDNPGLAEAAQRGEVIPVYIWAPEEEGNWAPGQMGQVWLRHALAALDCPLVIRRGPTIKALKALIKETGAEALYFSRRYEPAAIKRDEAVINTLNIEVKTFNASLLVEPWEVCTKAQKPFQVYTPFYNAASKHAPFTPHRAVPLRLLRKLPSSDALDLPDTPISWEVGEKGAQKQLARFTKHLDAYDTLRDRPDLKGVSKLSPYLHFGEISPRQVWKRTEGNLSFVKQLFWREFAYHLLYHFPHTVEHPLREKFSHFPWKTDRKKLHAWQEGKTGFPIVDAGMRQLLQTGWMHNRVRMIVASFLTKDLLIPWQEGARWFWERLCDADLANNTLGWQWTAGCGADAAPFFRIFNPVTQGEKFDPEGTYVRTYVPELGHLSNKEIHLPQPGAIVDHKHARKRALEAYQEVKST